MAQTTGLGVPTVGPSDTPKPKLAPEGAGAQSTPVQTVAANEDDMEAPAIDFGYINAMWGNGSADYPWPTFNVTAGSCFRLRLIAPTGQTSGM